MPAILPRTTQRVLSFANGTALGLAHRWEKGQYCSILTPAGLVGCGIYDLETPAEFDQAIAIARGTPSSPLTEPEDLLEARIVGRTPRAAGYGVEVGISGREAVELLLRASSPSLRGATLEASSGVRVQSIDHVTLVVKDLEQSRRFYVDILGMREVARPAFSFAGLWFQAGATQIHLILEYEGSGPAGNPLPAQRRTSRCQHLAFLVEDAQATLAFLQTQQVPILSDPKPRPDGYLQIFLTDPDGHIVELCSPPRLALGSTPLSHSTSNS